MSGKIELPRDDSVRSFQQLQWWYWTGHLETAAKRRFGFELVVFVGYIPLVLDGQMAQCAVTDIDGDAFDFDSDTDPKNPPKIIPNAFDFALGPVKSARGGGGHDYLKGDTGKYAFELELKEGAADPILHYDGEEHRYRILGGAIDIGYTYYYSREAMTAEGKLKTPDSTVHDVTGTAWFDRQWGELFLASRLGWQWFAIQLDDGTRIMIFDFVEDSYEDYGSITTSSGKTTDLGRNDIRIDVLATWESPKSKVVYPSKWRVRIPGYDLVVTPWVADQELIYWCDTTQYWEGACRVEASGKDVGQAYVELTGFSQSVVRLLDDRQRATLHRAFRKGQSVKNWAA